MEVPGEFHHFLAAGERTRQTQRHMGRLRPGAYEPDHLGARYHLDYQLRPFHLQLMARPWMRASIQLFPDGIDDLWVQMTENKGPVTDPVVNDVVSVNVPLVRPLCAINIDRERFHVPLDMRDPAGKRPRRALVELLRCGEFASVLFGKLSAFALDHFRCQTDFSFCVAAVPLAFSPSIASRVGGQPGR